MPFDYEDRERRHPLPQRCVPNVKLDYACCPPLWVVQKVVGEGEKRYTAMRRLYKGMVVYTVKHAMVKKLFSK